LTSKVTQKLQSFSDCFNIDAKLKTNTLGGLYQQLLLAALLSSAAVSLNDALRSYLELVTLLYDTEYKNSTGTGWGANFEKVGATHQ